MRFIPLSSSSKGNAYLLQSKSAAPLLIEAGLSIKRLRDKLREHGVSLSDLAGCLVSHGHSDHSVAVRDLLKAGVDVWMSAGTAQAIAISGHHRYHPVAINMTEVLPQGWRVIAFPLEHDAIEPVGYFITDGIDRLLFIPDTQLIKNRFSGITIIAIEVNYQEEILHENISQGYLPSVVGQRTRRNHLSLETVKQFLLANDLSRVKQIFLLHLSSGNSNEEAMRREIQELTGIPCIVCGE